MLRAMNQEDRLLMLWADVCCQWELAESSEKDLPGGPEAQSDLLLCLGQIINAVQSPGGIRCEDSKMGWAACSGALPSFRTERPVSAWAPPLAGCTGT